MAGTFTYTDMASDTNSGTSHTILGKRMDTYSVTYTNLFTELIGLSYTISYSR